MLARNRIPAIYCSMLTAALVFPADGSPANAPAGFLSACRTEPGDPILGTVVVALVHEFAQNSTIVYRVDGPNVEPLAELHHETPEHSEFLDSQGGMESAAVASDIVAFLRRQPFRLVKDWKSAVVHPADLPQCRIDYVETRRYRESGGSGRD